MLLANSFALSDINNSISIPWNRGGIANSPLLKTLFAKSLERQVSGK